jgi:hypothetical protein
MWSLSDRPWNRSGVAVVDSGMSLSFAVTWDYRCPFARNAHEHLLTGLEAGADWEVSFLSFCLDQAHVEEGGTPVFDEPDRYPALLSGQVGIVVRDRWPERFFAVHRALFATRHDQALDLREREVLAKSLSDCGVDSSAVFAEIEQGWPLEQYRSEHNDAVTDDGVFGVPTFITDDRAVFVRLLDRPGEDAALAIRTIERTVGLITDWPELNEFKYTRIKR